MFFFRTEHVYIGIGLIAVLSKVNEPSILFLSKMTVPFQSFLCEYCVLLLVHFPKLTLSSRFAYFSASLGNISRVYTIEIYCCGI